MKKPKEYAMYKGDKFITMGTVGEIAITLHKRKELIYFYTTKAYYRKFDAEKSKNRIIMVRVDEEECE